MQSQSRISKIVTRLSFSAGLQRSSVKACWPRAITLSRRKKLQMANCREEFDLKNTKDIEFCILWLILVPTMPFHSEVFEIRGLYWWNIVIRVFSLFRAPVVSYNLWECDSMSSFIADYLQIMNYEIASLLPLLYNLILSFVSAFASYIRNYLLEIKHCIRKINEI